MVGGLKPEGYGTKKAEGVPGHACAVPVGAGAFGGARGCIQRPKVSTIVMRPPQHGHGRSTDRRAPETGGKAGDHAQVVVLGLGGKPSHGHVLDNPLT